MRFEVNRKAMLEAAKSVAKIVPSNSPVEELQGILIESNEDTGEVYMTATNHEVSIQHKVIASVAESGVMLINSRLLVDMMSKLEGEFVTLCSDSPELLRVFGGSCTFHINCLSPKNYPKPTIPFPDESVIMTGICSLAKRTTFAVSKDDSKPVLQCVNIKFKNNAIHAAACDSMRLMLVKDSAEQTEEREFLLPGRSLQMLASISGDSDVFEVGDIGKEIVFVRGDMIFSIRKLVTGNYIDTAALLKNLNLIYSAMADVGKMKEALNLISVSALSGDTKQPINLVLSDGKVILRCSNDYSDSGTEVSANISKETPDIGFFYDVLALIKIFQVLSGKVKIEMDAKGYMLIRTRNEVYFQAPMRPPVKKTKPEKQTKGQGRAKGAEDVKETKEAKEAA